MGPTACDYEIETNTLDTEKWSSKIGTVTLLHLQRFSYMLHEQLVRKTRP